MQVFDAAGKVKTGAGGGDPVSDVLQAGPVGVGDGAITRQSAAQVTIAGGSGWLRQSSGALLRQTWAQAVLAGIGAAAVNPRVDQFVADATGAVQRVQGTEQAGATLDNAAGVTSRQALPAGSLLVAEALVKTSGIGAVVNADFRDRRNTTAHQQPALLSAGMMGIPTRVAKGTVASAAAQAVFTCPPGMQFVLTSFKSTNVDLNTGNVELFINGSAQADKVGYHGHYSQNGASPNDVTDAAAFYLLSAASAKISGQVTWPRRGQIVLNPGDVLWAKWGWASGTIGYVIEGYFTPVGPGFPSRLNKVATLNGAAAAAIYTCNGARAIVWSTPCGTGATAGTANLYLNGSTPQDRIRTLTATANAPTVLDPGCLNQTNDDSTQNHLNPAPPIVMNNGDVLYAWAGAGAGLGCTVFGVEF